MELDWKKTQASNVNAVFGNSDVSSQNHGFY
jgi:hypothetical protein